MKKCPKAFTLVELLIVISIIAMLMSILMPILSKVRAQARTVVCATNERQIGLLLGNYNTEYNGAFPPECGYPWLSNSELRNQWGNGITWQHCLANPANPRAAVTEKKGANLAGIRCPWWPKSLGGFAHNFSTTGGYAINDNLDGLLAWQLAVGADPQMLKQLYTAARITNVRNAASKICVVEATAAQSPTNPETADWSKDTVESWGLMDTVKLGKSATAYKYRGWLRIDHGQYRLSSAFAMKQQKVLPKDQLLKQKFNCLFIDGHVETVTLKRISENVNMWMPYQR